jgi:hypothetical protein
VTVAVRDRPATHLSQPAPECAMHKNSVPAEIHGFQPLQCLAPNLLTYVLTDGRGHVARAGTAITVRIHET